MNIRLLILGVAVLLICVGLSGCTDEPFFKGTGTVEYIDLEGGFYGIIWDQAPIKRLELLDPYPPSLPEEYREDGLRIEFEAIYYDFDMHHIHMCGVPVKIIAIQPLDE